MPVMKPLLLAGHAALEFLNTAFAPPTGGQAVEMLGDGQSLLAWLVEAGLLSNAAGSRARRRFDAAALDEVAREARKLRQWTIGWIERWIKAPDDDYASELQRLNRLLEQGNSYREVVAAGGRFTIVEHGRLDDAKDLLAMLASQVAKLITSEAPELVKRCAGADCILWFVDRTKAHRRIFCSAAQCGNRAKVAAFRERQRTS
jgi:predicted RNA-binding Zn ribbon-like protein